MIGALSLLRRKPEHDLEQFRHHWLHVHGPLAAKLHGVRRYVQSHFDPEDPLTNDCGRRLQIDGLAAISFETEEDREICYASQQEEICDKDSLLFIGASARYVTNVMPWADGPEASKHKLVLLIEPGLDLDEVLRGLSRQPGIGQFLVHEIVKPGAAPTQERKQIDLPLGRIVEIGSDSLPCLSATRERVLASTKSGVAAFGAIPHPIV